MTASSCWPWSGSDGSNPGLCTAIADLQRQGPDVQPTHIGAKRRNTPTSGTRTSPLTHLRSRRPSTGVTCWSAPPKSSRWLQRSLRKPRRQRKHRLHPAAVPPVPGATQRPADRRAAAAGRRWPASVTFNTVITKLKEGKQIFSNTIHAATSRRRRGPARGARISSGLKCSTPA